MDFAHTGPTTGKTATRIAVVGAIHVVLAIGLIHSMNFKKIALPKVVELMMIEAPKIVEPPPPPPPTVKPMPKVAPPDVIRPATEVPVEQTEPTITSRVEDDTPVVPAVPGPIEPAAPVTTNTDAGMHTAVMADANACQKPNYPVAAARNGDTGTVTLALLVGADGRVADSKVQKTSGFRDLDRAARSALSLCQFKAAMTNGVPQQAWAQISYVWTLE